MTDPILVEDSTGVRLAKYGANKLFGNNPDERRYETSDEELLSLFKQVWDQRLERAIATAEACEASDAYERITKNEQKYFSYDQEHRQFRLQDLNIEFIAQLDEQARGKELTQLWRVSSSDTNPKTLYVNFDTVEERRQFRRLATKLGFHDEKLGLQLVLEFMAKFPDRFLE